MLNDLFVFKDSKDSNELPAKAPGEGERELEMNPSLSPYLDAKTFQRVHDPEHIEVTDYKRKEIRCPAEYLWECFCGTLQGVCTWHGQEKNEHWCVS